MIFDWFDRLPPDAWLLEIGMLALVFWLIRSVQSPGIFALVAFPGTVCHELSHAVLGLILGGRPCNFSLFPKKLPDGRWQLGSVGFASLHWWSAPPVAMAPLTLAPVAVWLVSSWVYGYWQVGDLPGAAWRLGICSVIFQASWPSSTDFYVATPGLVVMAAIGWQLGWFG